MTGATTGRRDTGDIIAHPVNRRWTVIDKAFADRITSPTTSHTLASRIKTKQKCVYVCLDSVSGHSLIFSLYDRYMISTTKPMQSQLSGPFLSSLLAASNKQDVLQESVGSVFCRCRHLRDGATPDRVLT